LPEQDDVNPARPRHDGSNQDAAQHDLSIEVTVLNTGRVLLLSTDREILVGRLDSAHGIFPELDMTVDGGLEEGVSRRHARIYMRDGTCFVEDLDSTNFTFVNKQKLVPGTRQALTDGDELRCGRVALIFTL